MSAEVSRGAIVLTLCALAGPALGLDDDPGGFRGIAWGTPIAELADQLQSAGEGRGDLEMYRRPSDPLTLGEAKLETIRYFFWRGKFESVLVKSEPTASDRRAMLDAFIARFGRPREAPLRRYFWRGPHTSIAMDCLRGDQCTAMLASVRIEQERRAAEIEAARKGRSDF